MRELLDRGERGRLVGDALFDVAVGDERRLDPVRLEEALFNAGKITAVLDALQPRQLKRKRFRLLGLGAFCRTQAGHHAGHCDGTTCHQQFASTKIKRGNHFSSPLKSDAATNRSILTPGFAAAAYGHLASRMPAHVEALAAQEKPCGPASSTNAGHSPRYAQ